MNNSDPKSEELHIRIFCESKNVFIYSQCKNFKVLFFTFQTGLKRRHYCCRDCEAEWATDWFRLPKERDK